MPGQALLALDRWPEIPVRQATHIMGIAAGHQAVSTHHWLGDVGARCAGA